MSEKKSVGERILDLLPIILLVLGFFAIVCGGIGLITHEANAEKRQSREKDEACMKRSCDVGHPVRFSDQCWCVSGAPR